MSTTICKAGAALARHRQQKYYQPPSGGGGGGVCSLLQPEQQVEQGMSLQLAAIAIIAVVHQHLQGLHEASF